MEHVYDKILGWFDYADLYSYVLDRSPKDSHFVEVGCFVGKSISYLAVEGVNREMDLKLDAVDNFSCTIKGEWPWAGPLDFKEHFKKNMKEYGLSDKINLIEMDSIEASKKFEDKSLDFVFIDATHDYENVKKDILCWFPKIKVGGYIGGHDYNREKWNGVVEAVDGIFKNNIKLMGNERNSSWLYHNDLEIKFSNI